MVKQEREGLHFIVESMSDDLHKDEWNPGWLTYTTESEALRQTWKARVAVATRSAQAITFQRMAHHELVVNRDDVLRLGRLLCSSGGPHLSYVASRRKYDPDAPDSFAFERREYSTPEELLRNALRTCVPIGAFEGVTSDKALVFYAMVNPFDYEAAYRGFTRNVEDQRWGLTSGPLNVSMSKYKSCIHASRGKTNLFDIDIDTKDPNVLADIEPLVAALGDRVVARIETRGGFHILVSANDAPGDMLKPFTGPRWSFIGEDRNGKPIKKLLVEIHRHGAVPVPGTLQGGFLVRFVDHFSNVGQDVC